MKRVNAKELTACRIYFTEFDRITYSQVAWTETDVEKIKEQLERKLKLLALVKGHVVIAASHLLESELAREVILPNPELLSSSVVVPALRTEFARCADFLQSKIDSDSPGEAPLYTGGEQREMAQLIDTTATVMEWDVQETTTWFKSRLLADLQDDFSPLGLTLKSKGFSLPRKFCEPLQEAPLISRGLIYKVTRTLERLDLRDLLNSYADFLYYLAGARAVQSESVLPQENIYDFGFGDLVGRRTRLSEHEVFFKIFVDIVKAATSIHFPVDLLDALSFRDVIGLHEVAVNSDFTEKYNQIQERTKQGLVLRDPEKLVLLMQEIEELESNLREQFRHAIETELPHHHREVRTRRGGKLLHAIASLVISPYGLAAGLKDILITGLRFAGKVDVANSIEKRIEKGTNAFAQFLGAMVVHKESPLLSFVDDLKKRYAENLL